MKISKKFNHFVHFIIINFFRSLVNTRFSNLKVNIFIINSFICSNKCVKQLVLINQITKGMGTVVLFIIQKLEEGTFFPKKEGGW